jgi:hypothetical protein
MTVSTVIYYSGYHPYTLKPVYTAKSKEEKLRQRSFFFWHKPEHRDEIRKILNSNGLQKMESLLFDKGSQPEKKNRTLSAKKRYK